MNLLIIDTIIYILDKCTISELMKFTLVSKKYYNLVKIHPWPNVKIKLYYNDTCHYVLNNYKFVNIDLSCSSVTNELMPFLSSCQTLNLAICFSITDIHHLSNCQNLNLSHLLINDIHIVNLQHCRELI